MGTNSRCLPHSTKREPVVIGDKKSWRTATGALRNKGWYIKMYSEKNKDKKLLKALRDYTKLIDERYGKNAFRYFMQADIRVLY